MACLWLQDGKGGKGPQRIWVEGEDGWGHTEWLWGKRQVPQPARKRKVAGSTVQSPVRLTLMYVPSDSRSACLVIFLSTLFLNEIVWLFQYSGLG